MTKKADNFEKDIADISKIPIVTTLLDVICQTTGMGFAAIARVTETNWIACSVRDAIGFGLKPGGELEIKTTICDEIRDSGKAVIIDNVSEDPYFSIHHTPLQYGFQSYISVPIFRKNGHFFGTLCAIDPNPHLLSTPAVSGMFNLFADLISFHLEAIEEMDLKEIQLLRERAFSDELEMRIQQRTQQLEENNAVLEKMNKELQSFAYISSHDLQEPLRKIQTFASIIAEKELDRLSESGKIYFDRMQVAAERMQILINDLLVYSRTNIDKSRFEPTDLKMLAEQVKEDFRDELAQQNGTIEILEMTHANVIAFQFRQLLYNLISNAIKFSDPDHAPRITIQSNMVEGKNLKPMKLNENRQYCHIRVADNGIGFEQQYGEKIFELFQRLNHKSEYNGTGIGLAIVKKIVENHQGNIIASGAINKGATFDIYLPVS